MSIKMKENVIQTIKRHEALVQFSREHHYGLLLVWKIRQGIKNKIEPERITNYTLFFFEKDLQQHFSEEETTLFTKLAEDDVLKQQAIFEHEKIYTLIESIRKDKNNYELLNLFTNTLENHIRFEERTLFRHIQDLLPEGELEQHHSKKEYNVVDNNWSDHFWESGKLSENKYK